MGYGIRWVWFGWFLSTGLANLTSSSRTMFNRAYVYMALAAFFAQAIGSHWVASHRGILIVIVAFFWRCNRIGNSGAGSQMKRPPAICRGWWTGV